MRKIIFIMIACLVAFSSQAQIKRSITDALQSEDFIIRASLGLVPGVTTINKFGESSDVDTATDPQDVWSGAATTFSTDGGTYTFSTTATIDSISSDNAGDTEVITIVGLDTNWDEVTQNATLNGLTPVVLSTPLIRVYRAYNANGTEFSGDVYIYEGGAVTDGVPDDLSKLRCLVTAAAQQTEMAIYTVPNGKTALFVQGYVAISRGGASNVANFTYKVRPFNGVFRVQGRVTCSTQGSNYWIYKYGVPAPVPAKADIKITCESVSANDTGVIGGYDLLIFDNNMWGL